MIKKLLLTIVFVGASFPCAFSFPTGEITNDNINVRLDSTIQADSLGTLNKGETVQIAGESYGWYRIVLPQRFGAYVSSEYIKRISQDAGEVTAGVLRLRQKPSLESRVLGKAMQGEIFPIVREDGQWYYVKPYPRLFGWVHERFVAVQGEQDIVKERRIAGLTIEELRERLKEPMAQKGELHEDLIAEGPLIVPFMETFLEEADDNTTYSVIFVLAAIGKEAPGIVPAYFAKVESRKPLVAGIYLDIIQDAILPPGIREPYFYWAKQGALTAEKIEAVKQSLQEALHQKPDVIFLED